MKKIFETSELLNIAPGEVSRATHRDPSFDIEDGGQAIIIEALEPVTTKELVNCGGNGMFIRVQSWDDSRIHEDLRKFNGKRLRVTVEADSF